MSGPRSIACLLDLSGPLHLAEYDPASQSLDCARCGRVTNDQLDVLLSDALWSFEVMFPSLAPSTALAIDEREAERVAELLFRALPREPEFALELLLGWAARTLGGRLSEAHVEAAAERAFDRVNA